MTIDPNHHFAPGEAYNRLLSAFDLEQTPENDRKHFTALSDLLGVRMSTLSDCIRKGTVTGPVLEAAKAKGINPDYIINGTLPVRLDGFVQE